MMNRELLEYKQEILVKLRPRITPNLLTSISAGIPAYQPLAYYQGRQEILVEISYLLHGRGEENTDMELLGFVTAQIIILEDIINEIRFNN